MRAPRCRGHQGGVRAAPGPGSYYGLEGTKHNSASDHRGDAPSLPRGGSVFIGRGAAQRHDGSSENLPGSDGQLLRRWRAVRWD